MRFLTLLIRRRSCWITMPSKPRRWRSSHRSLSPASRPIPTSWTGNVSAHIADKCGAYLLADIAHISGLVASGEHPSPIGIADVVSTTTHKSLCGPRGAMLMTHRSDISRKIDRAVFPGEQGGPHLNTMAALAIALKLAKTEQFRDLQKRIVQNASRLAQQLEKRGLRVVGGGSRNPSPAGRHEERHPQWRSSLR